MPTTAPASTSARGYSDALESFIERELRGAAVGIVRTAREIVEQSPLFKRKADRLNEEYAAAVPLEAEGSIMEFGPNSDGELTKGKFAGRHTLVFSALTEGSRFLRAGSLETRKIGFPFSDHILLKLPMTIIDSPDARGEIIAELAASLVHETMHAFHRVPGRPARPSGSLADQAAAFIQEEVTTREEERAILTELLALKSGKQMMLEAVESTTRTRDLKKHIEHQIALIKVSPAEVERDFVSGSQLTYLETFVLEEMIDRSLRKKDLDRETVQGYIDLVKRVRFDLSPGAILRSATPGNRAEDPASGLKLLFLDEFPELLLIRRLVELDWSETTANNAEATLQSHAEAVFPQEVRYRDLPPLSLPTGNNITPQGVVSAPSGPGAGPLFSSRILKPDAGRVLVPAPAERPKPGKFYRIASGDGLFEVSGEAYGTGSMQTARLINECRYNRRFWRPAPDSEQRMFPDGRISFRPTFVDDLRAQMEAEGAAPSGHSFAMIWIPEKDGSEPL